MNRETIQNKRNDLQYFNEDFFLKHNREFEIPQTFAQSNFENLVKFLDLPLPHKKLEEWRRTDISRLPFDDFLPLSDETLNGSKIEGDVSGQIVINGKGVSVSLHDELARKGVIFTTAMDALRNQTELFVEYFNQTSVSNDQAKFQYWNSAFFNRGVFLRVPKNVVIEKPFEVIISGNFDGRALIMRNIMALQENASATIEFHYRSEDKESKYLVLVSDEGFCENNARLEVLTLQNISKKSFFFSNSSAKQSNDSRVDWHNIALGSKLHKSFVGSELNGKGAETNLNGAYFAGKKQHIDMRTMQIHNSGNTNSNLLFKGAVKDKAHTVYQGMIKVAHGAQIVDAYQTNKNLVLNEGARADSIPGLEILADDVKCSHGATVGHINPEEIFYLQSRGIDAENARKIIIGGFFEDVLARIGDQRMGNLVRDLIDEKINQ